VVTGCLLGLREKHIIHTDANANVDANANACIIHGDKTFEKQFVLSNATRRTQNDESPDDEGISTLH
jgi:hypothetical protein